MARKVVTFTGLTSSGGTISVSNAVQGEKVYAVLLPAGNPETQNFAPFVVTTGQLIQLAGGPDLSSYTLTALLD